MVNGIESGIGITQAFPAVGGNDVKSTTTLADDAGKFFNELVGKVNDMQQKANTAVQDLSTGQSQGLHEVMIAMEESTISFQFLTQVRNKAVEAYQEVMRMQV